jgi:acetate---CoA ligase (ADP-forming)
MSPYIFKLIMNLIMLNNTSSEINENFEIRNFFYPSSICIVGASTKVKSIGYELLHSISNYGFNGLILPVNPKANSILGYKCYKSIEEITDTIDLGIIVVPKPFVEESIDAFLRKNVKSILLITAGFKETGKEGEELENKILNKIRKAGARLVGPNCMGVINTLEDIKLNATFVAEKPETGRTGFFSQSGALGAAVLNSLRESDIKFAHFISAGNKADINENDLLHYWQNDSNIKTLTYYLESFVNGEEFLKPFIKGEITKPVIILKAGKTSGGMKAASSHTGALSSKDKVVDAALKQFGLIRANNLNDMFNTAKGFENFPLPKGNRIAIITNAGGPAILAVDSLEKENLVLAEFNEKTKQKLKEIVFADGSIENPVDLLPAANADMYKAVNEIVVADDNVDAIISIFVQPVMVSTFDVVESVSDVKTEKPILQVEMSLPEFWDTYRRDSKKQLPIFKNPEDPSVVISNMLYYSESTQLMKKHRKEYDELFTLKTNKGHSFSPGFLNHEDVNEIIGHYDIPVVENKYVKPDDIKNLTNIEYPIVVKGINNIVVHKSEINAVKINIKNKEDLLKATEEIQNSFSNQKIDVEYYLIQPYIKIKHEVLIGGYRDVSFGPIIMFGTGGKYVEILCDTAIKSAYLSNNDINEMIDSTTIGKILKGVRGEKPINLDKLRNTIRASANMMIENPNIEEFDLNPLIINEAGSIAAVDVRIKSS